MSLLPRFLSEALQTRQERGCVPLLSEKRRGECRFLAYFTPCFSWIQLSPQFHCFLLLFFLLSVDCCSVLRRYMIAMGESSHWLLIVVGLVSIHQHGCGLPVAIMTLTTPQALLLACGVQYHQDVRTTRPCGRWIALWTKIGPFGGSGRC